VDLGTPLAITLVVGGVVTSLLTLLAIARVWNRAFWRKPEDADFPDPVLQSPGSVGVLPRSMVGSTAALVVFGVALTVFAGPLFKLAGGSAEIMLDRGAYIHSVLGDTAPVPAQAQPGDAK
jgi:multicomponent Na+:H+ antiporter subunit D